VIPTGRVWGEILLVVLGNAVKQSWKYGSLSVVI
jgi:hypothetical protein